MLEIKSLLIDKKFFEAVQEVEEFLEEKGLQEGMLVQRLIFDKEVFKEGSEALEWASSHGFLSGDFEEQDGQFLIDQLNESEFMGDSLVEVDLRRGVKANVGILRPIQESEMMLSLRNEDSIKFSENLPHVIELARVVEGVHAVHGPVKITQEMLLKMAENFRDNALGVDVSLDFDHEAREAAGWLKSVFMSLDGTKLLGAVKWTPKGALALSNRDFRYFSPEFTLNYVHPHTGFEHGPTLLGGALVNRPFLKMEAIVGLSNKGEGQMTKETISLSEHTSKVTGLEKEISDLKLSENVAKETIKTQKDEIVSLSEKVEKMEKESAKRELEEKNAKLFEEGKVNAAQLKALNEGKDVFEVLSLGEKLHTEAKGTSEEKKSISLSEKEKSIAMKLGMTEEEFVKYSGSK